MNITPELRSYLTKAVQASPKPVSQMAESTQSTRLKPKPKKKVRPK